jgi:hypothetical protein
LDKRLLSYLNNEGEKEIPRPNCMEHQLWYPKFVQMTLRQRFKALVILYGTGYEKPNEIENLRPSKFFRRIIEVTVFN